MSNYILIWGCIQSEPQTIRIANYGQVLPVGYLKSLFVQISIQTREVEIDSDPVFLPTILTTQSHQQLSSKSSTHNLNDTIRFEVSSKDPSSEIYISGYVLDEFLKGVDRVGYSSKERTEIFFSNYGVYILQY